MTILTDLLSLAGVPRWTIVRHLHPQSVAEHSFAVAIIARELIVRHPAVDARMENVLTYALVHDIDESVTGDIPTPAKRRLEIHNQIFPLLIPITMTELQVVKIADMMEAYTFLQMNAVGAHAKLVVEHIRGEMYDACAKYGWPDNTVVGGMVLEILTEEGRLRV